MRIVLNTSVGPDLYVVLF